jgi:predicted nucleic acid-binding protein
VARSDALQAAATEAVDALLRSGEEVFITPRVVMEYRAVATRPVSSNGLGLTAEQIRTETDLIEQALGMLPDRPDVYPVWRELVDEYGVMGRQVFDARLVAVMVVHGVENLLTLNASHFARFREITVRTPGDLGMG